MRCRRTIPEPNPERIAMVRAQLKRLRIIGEYFGDHDPDDSYDAGDD